MRWVLVSHKPSSQNNMAVNAFNMYSTLSSASYLGILSNEYFVKLTDGALHDRVRKAIKDFYDVLKIKLLECNFENGV